jgi:hypothetical protein
MKDDLKPQLQKLRSDMADLKAKVDILPSGAAKTWLTAWGKDHLINLRLLIEDACPAARNKYRFRISGGGMPCPILVESEAQRDVWLGAHPTATVEDRL